MAQFTLEQLKRFGITPNTDLGQHFLVDDNILRVAGELADLQPGDVVFEPGPGVGVLTDYLAQRVRIVHAFELDRSLVDPLAYVTDLHANVRVHFADALTADLATLDPPPNKLVSNLPYNVAAPIIAETLQHSPGIVRLSVMVQKEMADRFAAPVGSASYGALSVLIQGVCERVGMHKVSRAVFAPPPNVDSALIAFQRREPGEGVPIPEEVPAFAEFIKASFGQRRKTLANNLKQAERAERATTVELLASVGLAPAARPQELTPQQFLAVFRGVASAT